MTIQFRCQFCNVRIKVPYGTEGCKIACTDCGQSQTVPSEPDAWQRADQDALTGSAVLHEFPESTNDRLLTRQPVRQQPTNYRQLAVIAWRKRFTAILLVALVWMITSLLGANLVFFLVGAFIIPCFFWALGQTLEAPRHIARNWCRR